MSDRVQVRCSLSPMAIEPIPEQPPLGDLVSQPIAGASLIDAPAKAARSVLEARLEGALDDSLCVRRSAFGNRTARTSGVAQALVLPAGGASCG